MKAETIFRSGRVLKDLKKLKNTSYFPIQQLAIRGDADYILCVLGLFVWLELKKDDEEDLRPLQKYKAGWVKKTGGIAMKADPQNWPEVWAFLKQLDQGEKMIWVQN